MLPGEDIRTRKPEGKQKSGWLRKARRLPSSGNSLPNTSTRQKSGSGRRASSAGYDSYVSTDPAQSLKKDSMPRRYFMSYATANDDPHYARDFSNFKNLRFRDPGPATVEVYISVSEAEPRTPRDDQRLRQLRRLIESSSSFEVKSIRFKNNEGRDLSSMKQNLLDIAQVGSPDDFIFFSNRSADGPRTHRWYDEFTAQLEKFPESGLCGNTINRPCPDEADHTYKLHVQTYAFLTRLRHFEEFMTDMPGEHARTREQAIQEGELELSRRVLAKGLALTSVAWPDHQFTSQDEDIDPELPCGNMTMTPGHEDIFIRLPYFHWHDTQKAKRVRWNSILTTLLFGKNRLVRYFR